MLTATRSKPPLYPLTEAETDADTEAEADAEIDKEKEKEIVCGHRQSGGMARPGRALPPHLFTKPLGYLSAIQNPLVLRTILLFLNV